MNKPLTYYIETFGCQMNERDSETICGILDRMGMQPADASSADIIVLNTCAVRKSAEDKVWSRLAEIAAARRKMKNMPVVLLAGCMAQLPSTAERVREHFPMVRALVSPGKLGSIPSLLQYIKDEEPQAGELHLALMPPRGEGEAQSPQAPTEDLPRRKIPGVSAYVNIMYGCDNFCSYCIVPFVRGPQVSREPESIRREVEELAKEGYKEVTLLGQNVNAYGRDLPGDYGFADLLKELDQIEGLLRIRYLTSHPRDFTYHMVDTIKQCSKVCEHFHLPLQSGSNRILKAMNRGYTREHYLDLVGYIRTQIPDASITTDIIVGFPGETEEDFEDTLDVVRKARFDGAFTFIFSPRSGTAAAKMPDQIPHEIKTSRLQRLVEVQNNIIRENNRKFLGSVVEILVESKDPEDPSAVRGRTRTNRLVIALGSSAQPGDLICVSVNETGTWYLKGQVVR